MEMGRNGRSETAACAPKVDELHKREVDSGIVPDVADEVLRPPKTYC